MGSIDNDADKIKATTGSLSTGTGRKASSSGLGLLKGLNRPNPALEKIKAEEAKKKAALAAQAEKKAVEQSRGTNPEVGSKSVQNVPQKSVEHGSNSVQLSEEVGSDNSKKAGSTSEESRDKVGSNPVQNVALVAAEEPGSMSVQSSFKVGSESTETQKESRFNVGSSLPSNAISENLSVDKPGSNSVQDEIRPSIQVGSNPVEELGSKPVQSFETTEVKSVQEVGSTLSKVGSDLPTDRNEEVVSKSVQSRDKVGSSVDVGSNSVQSMEAGSINEPTSTDDLEEPIKSLVESSPTASDDLLLSQTEPSLESTEGLLSDSQSLNSKKDYDTLVDDIKKIHETHDLNVPGFSSLSEDKRRIEAEESRKKLSSFKDELKFLGGAMGLPESNNEAPQSPPPEIPAQIPESHVGENDNLKNDYVSQPVSTPKPSTKTTSSKPALGSPNDLAKDKINMDALPSLPDMDADLGDATDKDDSPKNQAPSGSPGDKSVQSSFKVVSQVGSNSGQKPGSGEKFKAKVDSMSAQTRDEVGSTVGSQAGSKWVRHEFKVPPTEKAGALSGTQLAVLNYIFDQCQFNGDFTTGFLTREQMMAATNLKNDTVKTAIFRLINKFMIDRVAMKDGRSGAADYAISREIYAEMVYTRSTSKSGQSGFKDGSQVGSQVGSNHPIQTNIQNNNINIERKGWWYDLKFTNFPVLLTDQNLKPFHSECRRLSIISTEQGGLTKEIVQDWLDRFPQYYAQQQHDKMKNVSFGGFFFNTFKEFLEGSRAVLNCPTRLELEQNLKWLEEEASIKEKLAKQQEMEMKKQRAETLLTAKESFEKWFDSSSEEEKGRLLKKIPLHVEIPHLYKEALRAIFFESLGLRF